MIYLYLASAHCVKVGFSFRYLVPPSPTTSFSKIQSPTSSLLIVYPTAGFATVPTLTFPVPFDAPFIKKLGRGSTYPLTARSGLRTCSSIISSMRILSSWGFASKYLYIGIISSGRSRGVLPLVRPVLEIATMRGLGLQGADAGGSSLSPVRMLVRAEAQSVTRWRASARLVMPIPEMMMAAWRSFKVRHCLTEATSRTFPLVMWRWESRVACDTPLARRRLVSLEGVRHTVNIWSACCAYECYKAY